MYGCATDNATTDRQDSEYRACLYTQVNVINARYKRY